MDRERLRLDFLDFFSLLTSGEGDLLLLDSDSEYFLLPLPEPFLLLALLSLESLSLWGSDGSLSLLRLDFPLVSSWGATSFSLSFSLSFSFPFSFSLSFSLSLSFSFSLSLSLAFCFSFFLSDSLSFFFLSLSRLWLLSLRLLSLSLLASFCFLLLLRLLLRLRRLRSLLPRRLSLLRLRLRLPLALSFDLLLRPLLSVVVLRWCDRERERLLLRFLWDWPPEGEWPRLPPCLLSLPRSEREWRLRELRLPLRLRRLREDERLRRCFRCGDEDREEAEEDEDEEEEDEEEEERLLEERAAELERLLGSLPEPDLTLTSDSLPFDLQRSAGADTELGSLSASLSLYLGSGCLSS